MKNWVGAVRAVVSSRGGATAIEYALVGALIALALIVGASSIGESLQGTFTDVAAPLSST